MIKNIIDAIKSALLRDVDAQLSSLKQENSQLYNRLACLENEITDLKKEKKESWKWDWPALSSIGSCIGAIMSVGALGFSLVMINTVYDATQKAALLDVQAKKIEYEARAKIELIREGSYDVFTVLNYGKIPIDNTHLFIQYFEIQGVNGAIVTNSQSDFGRFHPNDSQIVKKVSPLKSGPEPPIGFAMASVRGDQSFTETKPFETEVFIWLFYQRHEWIKESESLGNITNPQQQDALRKAIREFRNNH